MDILAAVVLGVVQGLTEFLPVSSSAHLIIVPWLLGWKAGGIAFDVALHVGSSLAIVAYFWRDWAELIGEVIRGVLARSPFGNARRRLGWYLVVGSLPAAVAGFFLQSFVESYLRSPLVTVGTLVAFAFVLYYSDRVGRQNRSIDDLTWTDSILVGVCQAVALVPGVSRSGITISGAMLRNVQRSAAARFSFLLSTPVILGAGVMQAWHLLEAYFGSGVPSVTGDGAGVNWSVLVAGVASAATSGFLCIRFFLSYLQNHGLLPFVIYRIGVAVVVLATYLGSSTDA